MPLTPAEYAKLQEPIRRLKEAMDVLREAAETVKLAALILQSHLIELEPR